MVLKALAKSMRLEISKTEVATPPRNAFLTLWYATDVPVPKNWTVQFFMERENHQELKDYYGQKIDMPIIRRLRGNDISFFRYDMHRPQWGPWRHFRARLGRKFEIIEPKKAMQPYGYDTPDDIPIKIKLPSSLHLKFNKPRQYQIRFRSGKGGRWGSWHGFEVVTSEVAGLKTVKPMTQNRLKMPLAPPVIETPRERQAFMLMGREVLVSSRIRHAADAKVEVEIQHGTHGRFSPVKVKLDKRAGKTVSMFTMHLTKTGDYRFRAKLASVPNAPWGMWRTFRVDRLNQKPIYKMKPQSPKKNMTVPFNKINSNSSGIIGK